MEEELQIPPHSLDHHIGPLEAPIQIIEYGDYECPYSAVLAPDLEELLDHYKNDICYVYRHFPLKTLHPHAEMAAIAAEAAHVQERFWDMHHMLFHSSAALSDELIDNIAFQLGLDMELFRNDCLKDELRKIIDQQVEGALTNGVISTPTLFVNNCLYEGASSYKSLKEVIEKILLGEDHFLHPL